MELLLEESAEKPVSVSGQQNPPEDEWWWKAEKKAHNNTKRDCSEPLHNEQSQRPPPESEHPKGCSEAQKSEAVISETQQKLERDWSRLATEKYLKSSGQAYEKLPVANQAYADTGLLAANPSILTETRQPQIFSLSTDLSRRDAPTERATNSLDIYEVDWRTLQFKTPFADDTRVNRPPTASVAGGSVACHLVWEATAHVEQGTAQLQGRHSFSRRASDHHTHAPPNIPFARTLEENSTLHIKAPYRVCSSYAAKSPTACDQGHTNRRTPGNAAVRRSASWERMHASYRRLHRGRSVPPEKSASVPEKRLHLGSDCFRHTDPSAANRVSQLLPSAGRAWALLPVCHTFSRLATVNCSGTPLESEALQAFAGLVSLKNLVLAGCNLKDVNFLTCFVGAVPLQRLIVPFNEVDTLLVRNCTEASVFSADDGDESRSISNCVYTGSALELEGAASLAVAQKELRSAKPHQGKDLQTVTAKRGAIHLAEPGLTRVMQCVQTREVDQGCEDQEGVSEHDNSAIHPNRKEKDPVQGDSSTGIKGTGKYAPEEHEDIVAEITLGETSGQRWRRGRSTTNILQSGKPEPVNSSATVNVFPASLLLVDLSYNCLSDARELLPFSSNFGDLRTLKVSGNFFHTEPSSLLMQVKRTLTSRRINFECGNQLMKKETEQGFLGDLSGRSLCTDRVQTALSESPSAAAFSQSCQKPFNIGKLGRKHAYVSATSPSAGDELQRLQELVKRLAREKATLAEELKQARQQTRPGRHEKSPTSPTKITVCDRERNICALPQRYEETSGLGDRLNRQGAEAHLSQGCETALGLTNRHWRRRNGASNRYNDHNRRGSRSGHSSSSSNSNSDSSPTNGKRGSGSTRNYTGNKTRTNINIDESNSSSSRSVRSCSRSASSSTSNTSYCREPSTAAVRHFQTGLRLLSEEKCPPPSSVKELTSFVNFLLFAEGVKRCSTGKTSHTGRTQCFCRCTTNCPRPSSSSATVSFRTKSGKTAVCRRRPHTGRTSISHAPNGHKPLYSTDTEHLRQVYTRKREERVHRECESSILEVFLRAGVCFEDLQRSTEDRNWAAVARLLEEVQKRGEDVKVRLLQVCSTTQILRRQATETGEKCLMHVERLEKARRAFTHGLKQLPNRGARPTCYDLLTKKLGELEYIRRTLRKGKRIEGDESAVLRILRAFQEISPGGLEAQAELVSPALAKRALLLKSEVHLLEETFHKHVLGESVGPRYEEPFAAAHGPDGKASCQLTNEEALSAQKALLRLRQLEHLLAHRFQCVAMIYFNTLARLFLFYERAEDLRRDWEAANAVRNHLKKICTAYLPQQKDHFSSGARPNMGDAGALDGAAAGGGTAAAVVSAAPTNQRQVNCKLRGYSVEEGADNVAMAAFYRASTGIYSGRKRSECALHVRKRCTRVSAKTRAATATADATPNTAPRKRTAAAAKIAAQAAAEVYISETSARMQATTTAAATGRANARGVVADTGMAKTTAAVLPSRTRAAEPETQTTLGVEATATAAGAVAPKRSASTPGNLAATAAAATVAGAATTGATGDAGDTAMFRESIQLRELHLRATGARKDTTGLKGEGVTGEESGTESSLPCSVDLISCSISVPVGEAQESEQLTRLTHGHLQPPYSPQQKAFPIFNRRNRKKLYPSSSPVDSSGLPHASRAAGNRKDRLNTNHSAWVQIAEADDREEFSASNKEVAALMESTRKHNAAADIMEGSPRAPLSVVLHQKGAADNTANVSSTNTCTPHAVITHREDTLPARQPGPQRTGVSTGAATVCDGVVPHTDRRDFLLETECCNISSAARGNGCILSCNSSKLHADGCKATTASPSSCPGCDKNHLCNYTSSTACFDKDYTSKSSLSASTCCCDRRCTPKCSSTISTGTFANICPKISIPANSSSVSSFSCDTKSAAPFSFSCYSCEKACLPRHSTSLGYQKSHPSHPNNATPLRCGTRIEDFPRCRSRRYTCSFSMSSRTTTLHPSYSRSFVLSRPLQRSATTFASKSCDVHQVAAEPAAFSSSRCPIARSRFPHSSSHSSSSSMSSSSSSSYRSASRRFSSPCTSSSTFSSASCFTEVPLNVPLMGFSPSSSRSSSSVSRPSHCAGYTCPPSVPASLPTYGCSDQKEQKECKERPICSSSLI